MSEYPLVYLIDDDRKLCVYLVIIYLAGACVCMTAAAVGKTKFTDIIF